MNLGSEATVSFQRRCRLKLLVQYGLNADENDKTEEMVKFQYLKFHNCFH